LSRNPSGGLGDSTRDPCLHRLCDARGDLTMCSLEPSKLGSKHDENSYRRGARNGRAAASISENRDDHPAHANALPAEPGTALRRFRSSQLALKKSRSASLGCAFRARRNEERRARQDDAPAPQRGKNDIVNRMSDVKQRAAGTKTTIPEMETNRSGGDISCRPPVGPSVTWFCRRAGHVQSASTQPAADVQPRPQDPTANDRTSHNGCPITQTGRQEGHLSRRGRPAPRFG